MFGYIRPLKCELKMREYDAYRAAYCGLCNALSSRCGFLSRFIVNYDFTFLALLLSDAYNVAGETVKKRCIVCPAGRMCARSDVYDSVADISVVLTYLKLCDDVSDNTFFKSFFRACVPRMLLNGAYKKASKKISDYTQKAKTNYLELSQLEKERCASIDEAAHKFANMLSDIACGDDAVSRVLREMFYHIGRFVYIIDALDDFEEDAVRGRYNPIAERFRVNSETIPEETRNEVVEILAMSKDAILKAFELLPQGENSGLIRNIIELGMKNSVYTVLNKEKKKI